MSDRDLLLYDHQHRVRRGMSITVRTGIRLRRPVCCVLAVLMLSLALSGCASGTKAVRERELFAMDTWMTFRAYGGHAEPALSEITEMIGMLDEALDPDRAESEIAAINRSAEPVTVSADTAALLKNALTLSDSMDGALCLTLSPVIRAWGFVSGEYRIPAPEELKSLLARADDTQVRLDGSTVTTPYGMELDLGAVAKGYAADRAAALLREHGVTSALLDLGGSTIRTLGTKPDGSLWRIAIRDPEDAQRYASLVEIGEGAVDTSGGYERFFVGEDGAVYWHIIDPATGYPAQNGLLSVTVLTDDGFTGDALSTALFVMGKERAISYWRENGGFEFIMLHESDGILVSEGAAAVFVPQGRYRDADVTVIRHEQ